MKLAFSIMIILVTSWGSSVCADTYLNEGNVQGTPGSQYWDILAPGTYILNITGDEFITNNNYAIRIFASTVIFDGNGKTITGPSIGTVESGPSYYGIRVNSGSQTQPPQNVTVKNVTVSNKYMGVIYENVQGGEIGSLVKVASNNYGIYTSYCSNLNIHSNTVNSNNQGGIVLDSTNDNFTIDSNNIYSNGTGGITLWLSNNHNVINNNTVNDNNTGILLTDGGHDLWGTDNTISGNTVNGNVRGLSILNYHGNRMTGNSFSGNSNVGVAISNSSSGNQFTGNYVQESGWVGMLLESSANGNVFYNNMFKNVDNEFLDNTVSNNQWNTTPVTGVNIVGGPSIGGNYWNNPSYTGFSSNQLDSNLDGFCDESYNPQSNLIDNYPLLNENINTVKYLDTTNAKGLPGHQYWDILAIGTYILTDNITTDNNYAVRIFVSNVIFDGNGKTITGPGIGTVESGPSYYGIRVNSGDPTKPPQNVTVKNVTASNKYMGIIYESVQGGEIRSSQVASNNYGIYTWNCSNLNIRSNTVSSNFQDGIVLDADQSTNNNFTIDSNNVFSNGAAGITLWLSNNHNVINNNQVNDNNMGIVLSDGGNGAPGTDNTISGNTVNGNVRGLSIWNYHGNRITGNSLSGNSNVGVWISNSSSGNQFTGNYVQESGWVGMLLESSANGNVFYNNMFKNVDNEFLDNTVSNNQWNTTPVTGVNIVGGPTIGGNYWGNASSTGFSDTHADSNNDGFCDQPYNPNSELIDQYPLHKMAVFNVTPTSLNFGYVPVGSTKDLTLTVKNTGEGTLTGNATTTSPFSIFSGGSYILSTDQSQIVTIRYQPTSAGPHTGTVLFTGGAGATVPVTGKTEKPRGLAWEILLLGN